MPRQKKEKLSPDYVRAYGSLEELGSHRFKPLARLVYSTQFELFIAFVIATNAVALAILTCPNIGADTIRAAESVDAVCFAIYATELVIRIVSYGTKPWRFFAKGWNIFDFLLVASSPFFAGQTVVLRLLRLFRLIRIFRFLPEVRILSTSIIKSLPPLLSMSALIALLLFLYGMVGHYLFGNKLTEAWGSIGAAMMSLVILLTLENFPVYLEEAIAVNPLAIPYLLSYVFIIVFTVLNLLIGIVLNAMDEARAEAKKRSGELSELKLLSRDIEAILSDGQISSEELAFLQKELDRLKSMAERA
jgi:voltage-gated sodium channel